MRIASDDAPHLTYCTNVHPSDGWDSVLDGVRRYARALKSRFSPSSPFGIGLRLSALEARELLEGTRLRDFRDFLEKEGLYVALINGFPYGKFHGGPVKADVYAPDWRDEARVRYTLDLVRILGELLPEGLDGGISTSPLSYKLWLAESDREGWERITRNVARVAAELIQLRERTGRFIHLDIEPEPDCVLENSEETVAFFEDRLLVDGAAWLARTLGVDRETARRLLLDHIQLCFDCCHFAVEYEDTLAALARLRGVGIRIGRVQLSSALQVALPPDPAGVAEITKRLEAFAETTYLHQVVERRGNTLHHYPDLDIALRDGPDPSASEWRIHFHVPLFAREYGVVGSTQEEVRKVLSAAGGTDLTRHLEIETYTWDVLPAGLKIDLLESIAREYDWVLDCLKSKSSSPGSDARDPDRDGVNGAAVAFLDAPGHG